MKRNIVIGALVVFASALLAISACSPAQVAPPIQSTFVPTAINPPATAAVSQNGGAVTVIDGAKRSVTIPSTPSRILSLAPSTTEIAYALGLGPKLVAVDKFSDYPPEVNSLTKISTSPLNLEQVVALRPELVLAAGITSPDDVKRMEELKLVVIVVGAVQTTFESVQADVSMVAKATKTDDKATSINGAIRSKVDSVKAKIANAKTKPRVYWELDATDPTKPYTAGPGSFLNDIITLAGGVNAAANAKSPYAQINSEEVIAANPDVIILSDFAYGTTVESVLARKGWSAINAVKNAQVYPIDDNLVSRPGPRLADGVEAAAKLIHPEVFK